MLGYRTTYSDHGKISHGKSYECYHCSKFYVQKGRCKRHVENCLVIPGITYSFENENLITFEENYCFRHNIPFRNEYF